MFTRMPSSPRPALIVKQSSPLARVQYSMSTFLDDSISIPSPRGMPTERTVMPRIITLSQYTGTTFQNGVFSNVIPSI
ncbi:hypothetical protein D3C86_2071500 [compost metagenome]